MVQWKAPDSERRLNPVWFGDKLKSAERKIQGKRRGNGLELPAISPDYFMTLIPPRPAKLHSRSTPGLIASLKGAFSAPAYAKKNEKPTSGLVNSAQCDTHPVRQTALPPACEGLSGQRRSVGVIE